MPVYEVPPAAWTTRRLSLAAKELPRIRQLTITPSNGAVTGAVGSTACTNVQLSLGMIEHPATPPAGVLVSPPIVTAGTRDPWQTDKPQNQGTHAYDQPSCDQDASHPDV
jgi:hypothetical protein